MLTVSDTTPETLVLPPARAENPTKAQVKRFQGIIGSLMHPCVTDRPDVAHAVGVLSQYLIVPRDEHYLCALKIIKYLYRMQDWCLTFDSTEIEHKVSKPIQLTMYVDANWGNDTETCHSQTGFAIKLANGSVEYSSKLQQCVTLSSAESDYVALSSAIAATLGIKNTLQEVGFDVATPDPNAPFQFFFTTEFQSEYYSESKKRTAGSATSFDEFVQRLEDKDPKYSSLRETLFVCLVAGAVGTSQFREVHGITDVSIVPKQQGFRLSQLDVAEENVQPYNPRLEW